MIKIRGNRAKVIVRLFNNWTLWTAHATVKPATWNYLIMWDERYDTEEYVYGTEPNNFLVSVADRIPRGGKVLSLGEGEGRNAVYLAKLGYSVTAVDQSAVGLKKAERMAVDNGVAIKTIVSDLAGFRIEPDVHQTIFVGPFFQGDIEDCVQRRSISLSFFGIFVRCDDISLG